MKQSTLHGSKGYNLAPGPIRELQKVAIKTFTRKQLNFRKEVSITSGMIPGLNQWKEVVLNICLVEKHEHKRKCTTS